MSRAALPMTTLCAGGCGRQVSNGADRPDGVLRRTARGRCGTCYEHLRAVEGRPVRPPATRPYKRRSDAAPVPTLGELAWSERAACGEAPDRSAFEMPDAWRRWVPAPAVVAARRYCATCPVLAECDAFAARHGQLGLWGGRWWSSSGEPVEIRTVSGIAS